MTPDPHPAGASRIVFPLDVPDLPTARDWVRRLDGRVGVFKVGLELFTAHGPDAVRLVQDAGAACFLDLKLHDIPATMAGAVRAATRLGVRFLTVHASAGPAALAAAAEAADEGTTLLGVTVLTSLDEQALGRIGLAGPPGSAVVRLGHLATTAGIGGLVSSPREVGELRAALGPEVTLVVPGVRPAGSDAGDQARTATPATAIEAGADLLVIGRPIRHASDPAAAAGAIGAEIASAAMVDQPDG